MPLTVQEALSLPGLAGCDVVAGSCGLEREMSAVTVIDAPDGIKFIHGGEFILSTLFLYRGKSEDQISLIRELHARGAAALGVKLERFVDAISPDVRACADELCLPVITVPGQLAWKDVINAVLQELLGRQARELQQSWEIHRRFIDLAAEGRGLGELARTLGDLVNNPVLVAETCTGSTFLGGEATEQEGVRGVPEPWYTAPGEEAHPVASHNGIRRISSADREARLVCPIRTGRRHGGWIVVWEQRAVLDNWGLTAIQHAATVAALEVEKLQALRNLERTMRDDFLHHLVRGDFQTENSARERAWKLGWDMAEAYAAICFRLVSTPAAWTDEKTARAAWEVVDLLSGGGVPPGTMVGVDHAERPLVLYPVRADVPTERADDSVAGEVKRLLGSLKRLQPKLELLAGIGRPRKGVRGIGETYQEAVLALELAPAVPGIGPVIRFRDLGIHRLTRDVSASEVTEFVRDVLGPLLDFDRKHSTELMVTLRAFLEHGGNYREAARELYLHHSTVRYRLQQVEKLCGVNLSSARDRFNLQLALALMLANNFSS